MYRFADWADSDVPTVAIELYTVWRAEVRSGLKTLFAWRR